MAIEKNLVILEPLASGPPVAACPVAGPLDVIGSSGCGVLDEDLERAARAALESPRTRRSARARVFSWRRCAEQFLANLQPVDGAAAPEITATAD